MTDNNKLKDYEKNIATWCKSVQGKYRIMKKLNEKAFIRSIKSKKGTKKEGYSDWRTELIEKDVKGVEVNPSIDDATDPMSVFDKNKKLKGADKAVKEECGCDKEDDGSEKALAKKATKVKRVKYQDGVTESLAILRANIDELKSRYL